MLFKARTNNLLTPSKEASRGNLASFYYLNLLFLFFFVTQSINRSFKSFASFTLSLLNKVTIRTYNLVFIILNVL